MTTHVDNDSEKIELAARIGSFLFKHDISMGQAAIRFGMTQTGVAKMLRQELDDFSAEQLEGFLQALGE